ncbi:mismatch repair ATPase MSH6 [Sugiyamaella lignohabitans]|uniref:DNA mismatch repair protein MSH6 n=1 Tax=Sugiyamaella lignohabitans TaxID=796027 RepID=A0A167DRY8_9ASCO|nr:mismatch repair ATPase MSH6 [Sugiyamaella lignohabitans]ANB13221.1 mismatch repair ATPase MSH6 [Sugiyamaella lignohabitans]
MDDFIVDDEDDEEDEKPKKKRKSNSSPPASSQASRTSTEPIVPSSPPAALSKFSAGSTYSGSSKPALASSSPVRSSSPIKKPSFGSTKSFEKENEERYAWLVDIKDADGNREGDAEYDPRTLYIPKSAWAKFTAFEKQYWEIKSKMWNTVVFFKKGKFYELYERDADIAHGEFDLKLAGGGRANMRLAGIPEMSFDYWASAFIAKGHKVARVDQKETALAKEMNDRKSGKKEEKIIKRELSYVLTAGTLTDEAMLVDEMSTFCMAVKQQDLHFATCFVDTATGAFYTTEFEDDVDFSQFETLIAQIRPRELILEKGCIASRAVKILKNNTSVDTLWNFLKSGSEYWDYDTSYEELLNSRFFKGEDADDLSNYPIAMRDISKNKPLSMSAFGGLMWYLRSLKLDDSLISLGNFNYYETIQKGSSVVLDGQSLQNLEVFANTFDGGAEGTLFRLLNRCITPFGKRKLKGWVSHPLMDPIKINARLDTVEFLNNNPDVQEFIESKLISLPDLERLLSRIHAGHLKPKEFVRVIESFELVYKLMAGLNQKFSDSSTDPLLKELFESMPNLENLLPQWTDAFDRQKAQYDNVLVPEPGIEEEFDNTKNKIDGIEKELEGWLKKYKREYGSVGICYRDSGKEIYLIEVPVKVKNIPKDWQQMGATGKVKRYWSPEVRSLVRELQEARELHKVAVDGVQAKFYQRFDNDYLQWLKAVQILGSVDCLISLAKTSSSLGSPSCRPQFVESDRGVLDFKELRHPCFMSASSDFIPNDVSLGGENANITLLTGANAAGKSTVLRMTCTAVIMAQIGCYVPAESARLTPVDRIMTRLGANDNIFAGKSTFYVELSETKRILSEATNKSLIVLDELGRGGSSSDGFAIAEAVLHHLATHVGSLGFFATHYGTLNNSFANHPQVNAKRMAILVDESSRKVTFLYKLEDGVSPGSFGMHVASMCGIDKSIVDRAEEAARNFEHTARMKKMLASTSGDDSTVLPLGIQSDFVWALNGDAPASKPETGFALENMLKMIKSL